MKSSEFETVYTVYDYWDGILSGIADFDGVPHFYQRYFDEEKDDWSEVFHLKPLSNEVFQLALEDWEIWKRWYAASEAGETSAKTHPALPEDSARKDEIRAILLKHMTIDIEKAIEVKAEFKIEQEGNIRIFSANPRARVKVRWSQNM